MTEYTICSPLSQGQNSRLAVEKSVMCASLCCTVHFLYYPITKIVLTGRNARRGFEVIELTKMVRGM
jgi:hypothetical protein